MVNERSEIAGYTYEAQFLRTSLGQKYGVNTDAGAGVSSSSRLTADERMTTCNQKAGNLKGEARMQFMKGCLASLAR